MMDPRVKPAGDKSAVRLRGRINPTSLATGSVPARVRAEFSLRGRSFSPIAGEPPLPVFLGRAALHRSWDAMAATATYLLTGRNALANGRVSIIEGPFRGSDGRPLPFGETKLEQLRR